MDWLDDNVFNWAKADDADADDIFFFLDKSNGGVSGRSYSNASSRAPSRERSRTSSFKGHNGEGFKVERMTELPKNKTLDEVTRELREGELDNNRPTFTITQPAQAENKKSCLR